MNLFDIACAVAALLILVTAVAKLNDIKRTQKSKRWWVRRVGLLLVIVSMVIHLASYVTAYAPYWSQVMRIAGLWGFLLTWMTTPQTPPWWVYISRNDKLE